MKNIIGINNPNYKDGRTLGVYHCIVCKVKISLNSKSSKCRSCSCKDRLSTPSNNPNYKGGVKTNPYFCIECGAKIGYYAWKDGTKRCRTCHFSLVKIEGRLNGKNNPMYGKTGSLCVHWKGGKSFEPYPLGWTNTFKEQIRRRDNYKCQLCGVPETETGKRSDVHHIDYVKSNLNEKNLISLCKSCHTKTNFNREKWILIFKEIIYDKN